MNGHGCWNCRWMTGWLDGYEDAELTEQPGECQHEDATDEEKEAAHCHHWASNPDDWCD